MRHPRYSPRHYHVVFNGGANQDHWTNHDHVTAKRWTRTWNANPRSKDQVATVRACTLSEDACPAFRTYCAQFPTVPEEVPA